MARIETTKKYLLEKRAELMAMLSDQGYNGSDIGVVFNMDRGNVHRVLSTFTASPIGSTVGGSVKVVKSRKATR